MRKIYCDRCGKECEDFLGVKLENVTGYTKIIPGTYKDLCKACMFGLEQYLDGWEITEVKKQCQ